MKELKKLCNCSNCFQAEEVRCVRLYKKIKLKNDMIYYYNTTGYFTYDQLMAINGCGNTYCSCEINKLAQEEWNDAKPVVIQYKIKNKIK